MRRKIRINFHAAQIVLDLHVEPSRLTPMRPTCRSQSTVTGSSRLAPDGFPRRSDGEAPPLASCSLTHFVPYYSETQDIRGIIPVYKRKSQAKIGAGFDSSMCGYK